MGACPLYMFKPDVLGTNSIASLLSNCHRVISLPPLGLGNTPLHPWILWVLWTNRNKLVFENKLFSEQYSVLKAIQDARAWKAVQMIPLKTSLKESPELYLVLFFWCSVWVSLRPQIYQLLIPILGLVFLMQPGTPCLEIVEWVGISVILPTLSLKALPLTGVLCLWF